MKICDDLQNGQAWSKAPKLYNLSVIVGRRHLSSKYTDFMHRRSIALSCRDCLHSCVNKLNECVNIDGCMCIKVSKSILWYVERVQKNVGIAWVSQQQVKNMKMKDVGGSLLAIPDRPAERVRWGLIRHVCCSASAGWKLKLGRRRTSSTTGCRCAASPVL